MLKSLPQIKSTLEICPENLNFSTSNLEPQDQSLAWLETTWFSLMVRSSRLSSLMHRLGWSSLHRKRFKKRHQVLLRWSLPSMELLTMKEIHQARDKVQATLWTPHLWLPPTPKSCLSLYHLQKNNIPRLRRMLKSLCTKWEKLTVLRLSTGGKNIGKLLTLLFRRCSRSHINLNASSMRRRR